MLFNLPKKKKTVGLALGSGGVRGFAHIGVIEVLKENDIPIDFIAGASIGAWVGASYSLFKDLQKLKDITVGKRKEKLASLLDLGLSGGFVRGIKVKKLFVDLLDGANFSNTQIPFRAIATNLLTGKPQVFSSGPLVDAVQASMSIPGMFKPVEYKDKVLVDGGVSNPVPVDVVRQMGADIVIAINLDNYEKKTWFKKSDTASIAKVSSRSFDLMRHHLAQKSIIGADIIIEPTFKENDATIWKKYFWDGVGEEIIEAGRTETKLAIKKIKKLLQD